MGRSCGQGAGAGAGAAGKGPRQELPAKAGARVAAGLDASVRSGRPPGPGPHGPQRLVRYAARPVRGPSGTRSVRYAVRPARGPSDAGSARPPVRRLGRRESANRALPSRQWHSGCAGRARAANRQPCRVRVAESAPRADANGQPATMRASIGRFSAQADGMARLGTPFLTQATPPVGRGRPTPCASTGPAPRASSRHGW
jgi:hypothetical protein